jgi:DNA-binding NtrC family response regulator
MLNDTISIADSALRALVIDDEPQVTGFVARVLESDGWNVVETHTADEALAKIEMEWSLVFCDVVLGGMDGYEVLRRFSEMQPEARFVLMTGHGSAAGALDATSIGAYDYLLKPFALDDVIRISSLVREQHLRRNEKHSKKNPKSAAEGYISDLSLIGKSPKFIECLKMVGRVAATSLPVLITGESGTGKEVVARAIHRRSRRSSGPFITVNCGAIPNELIESELFGHAKGSFTGADRERIGLWEAATGGTLFLDEITETSPLFQVKLLRALQEGEIRRVGSNRSIKVDVRIIAATNCDIEEEVRQGRFRQDLMYRLNAVTISLPPLRDRKEDISLLAEHFAKGVRSDGASAVFSAESLELLKNYNWPGNIRELENAILHAVSLTEGAVYPEHLPPRLQNFVESPSSADIGTVGAFGDESRDGENEWVELARMEELYVGRVLAHTGGNKQAAARILNIDRKTLSRIISRRDTEN